MDEVNDSIISTESHLSALELRSVSTQTNDPKKAIVKRRPGDMPSLFSIPTGFDMADNHPLGKIMENFEKQMNEQMKVLDDMNKKMQEERQMKEKRSRTLHVPQQLQDSGRDPKDIWQDLLTLLNENQINKLNIPVSCDSICPRVLDNNSDYSALVQHALVAWFGTIPKIHRERLSWRVQHQVNEWIRSLWRLQRCNTNADNLSSSSPTASLISSSINEYVTNDNLTHHHPWEGAQWACRLAIESHEKKIGFSTFATTASMRVYISSAAPPAMKSYLTMQTGLLCSVMSRTQAFGVNETMDVAVFQHQVEADLAAGTVPLLVIAFAGSLETASVDDLTALHNVCTKYKIWLHVEGLKLCDLALFAIPTIIRRVDEQVDSVTLNVGAWLGLSAIPLTTFLMSSRAIDAALNCKANDPLAMQSLSSENTRLSLLPLWYRLQEWGHDRLIDHFKTAHLIMKKMTKLIDEFPSMSILLCANSSNNSNGTIPADHHNSSLSTTTTSSSSTTTTTSPQSVGFRDIIQTIISFITHIDTPSPVLVFKYAHIREKKMSTAAAHHQVAPYSKIKTEEDPWSKVNKPSFISEQTTPQELFYQALNIWLYETLSSNLPEYNFSQINLNSIGPCLRFCALETSTVSSFEYLNESLPFLQQTLQNCLRILDHSVSLRLEFRAKIQSINQLIYLESHSVPCLGHVAYLPRHLNNSKSLDSLSLNDVNLISQLNSKIYLSHLKKLDSQVLSLAQWKSSHVEEITIVDGNEDGKENKEKEKEKEKEEEEKKTFVNINCIEFSLVDPDVDVNHLIAQLLEAGHRQEEEDETMKHMEELVKRGIIMANEQITKENHEKIVNEGLLRQVPYIDSLMRWWTPVKSDANKKGCTLDLSIGQLLSTEDTYKYKVQLHPMANVTKE